MRLIKGYGGPPPFHLSCLYLSQGRVVPHQYVWRKVVLHSACFARRSSDLHSLSLLLHCNAALRWKCDSVLSTTGSVTPQGSQGSLHCATHMGGWGPSQDSLAKLARSSGQSKNLCWWRVNRVFLFWYLSLKYLPYLFPIFVLRPHCHKKDDDDRSYSDGVPTKQIGSPAHILRPFTRGFLL